MKIIEKIKEKKIISVVRIADKQKCIDTVSALIDGGIEIVELTLENSCTYDVINHFASKENSKVQIAAGGIITTQQAAIAYNAGAKLIVSPVFQMSLVKFCKGIKVPHISTATTPNEAYNAWKTHIPLIKIYPTGHLGGVEYIQDILRPMPFLNIIATGAIKVDEIPDYLSTGVVGCAIGRDFYQDTSLYNEITNRAKKAILLSNKNKS